MVNDLKISDALPLPIDAATARFVALGKSGSGKTNAGVVLAEELLGHGVTIAILDVLGNMHGLRAAGDGDGLPIAILGGLHGDVPVRADRGAVVADLVASGVSAVIDLSQMTREDAQEFAAAFFARLVPAVRSSGRNVHVIVEESETFAPQQTSSKAHNAARAAATVFARTARNVGIGWTFSTQRPQLLSKDVIDSSTAFIAMKMTGDLAQAAIGAEVRSRAGKTREVEIIADLPRLARGEAWLVPDPDWLGNDTEAEPRKFRFRWRHTFDSARPPKVGERREEPRMLADVDLAGLRDAMAEDGPIGDEKGQSRTDGSANTKIQIRIERVEVPVLLRSEIEEFHAVSRLIGEQMAGMAEILTKTTSIVDRMADRLAVGLGIAPGKPAQGVALDGDSKRRGGTLERQESAPTVQPRSSPTALPLSRPISVDSGSRLSPGAQAMLDELVARHPMRLTKAQLARLSGRSAKSSQFGPNVRDLLATGHVEFGRGGFSLTASGQKLAGVGRGATREATIARLTSVLPPSSSRMFRALVTVHPKGLARAALATAADISITSSGFSGALSDLRKSDLARESAGLIFAVLPEPK